MPPLDMISTPQTAVSSLVLSDRLIALAKAADRAGYAETAIALVTLAVSVFDEAPRMAKKPGFLVGATGIEPVTPTVSR